jgi:diguanylate cyclase (GGDEF)-like protein/PAS domain S-box-containing protein
MGNRVWTRQELEEHVRGKRLTLWSPDVFLLPVPEWLAARSAGAAEHTAAEVVARTHPDDGGLTTELFVSALGAPGEVQTGSFRFRADWGWVRLHTEMVNLADHPDVGGLLTATTSEDIGDDEAAVAPRSAHRGDHAAVPWMVETLNRRAMVLTVEGDVEHLVGRSAEEVVGRAHTDLLHAESVSDAQQSWTDLLSRPGATRLSRRCFVHPDGTQVWAECTLVNRIDRNGQGDVLLIAYDVSERREQEELLQRSHEEIRLMAEELRLLADQVPAAVFRADEDGRITFHNQRWSDLLGVVAEATLLGAVVHPGDRPALEALLRADDPTERTIEVRDRHGDRLLAIVVREVHDPGSSRRSFVGSVDDVTTTRALQRRALHDDLTGLLNRAAFEERVARALAEGDGADRCAVLFLDLDGFKAVNDTYGHEAGDAVLVALAKRLRRVVRPGDEIGRYGGDEFVVVCHGVDRADDATLAARLTRAFTDPITFDGGSWQPAGSIGAARALPGDDVATLIRRADQAMFAVKRPAGRRTPTTARAGST